MTHYDAAYYSLLLLYMAAPVKVKKVLAFLSSALISDNGMQIKGEEKRCIFIGRHLRTSNMGAK